MSCCESRERSNVSCVHHGARSTDLAVVQQDARASITTPASPGLGPFVTQGTHLFALKQ